MKQSIIIFFLLLLISMLGWEGYTQSLYPGKSILYALHQKGILTNYEIAFEPSKGIWFDIGWIGSLLFIIMMCYPLRKSLPFIKELNHTTLLDIHITCGLIGAILITFHTTFKLGGIVSISFWAMIIVTLSGIFGRSVYINIQKSNSSKKILKTWLWIHRPLATIMFFILMIHIVVVYLFKV